MATRRETDPRWGEVVVKEAIEPSGQARLRFEADLLGRTRMPGVVELLDHTSGPDRVVLVTRFTGPRTLGDLPGLQADQLAALGAALAQTLTDLHRLGVSHGNLVAEHVLLTDGGLPVLCGLGDAGIAGVAGEARPVHVSDHGGTTALARAGFDPAADAATLARLLRSLLLTPATGRRRAGNHVADLLDASPPLPVADLAEALARLAGPRHPPLCAPSAPGPAPASAPAPARSRPGLPPLTAAEGPGGILANDPLADWFFSDALLDEPTRDFGPQPATRSDVDGGATRYGWRRRPAVLVALAVVAVLGGAFTVLALGGPSDPAPAAMVTAAAEETAEGAAEPTTTVPSATALSTPTPASSTASPGVHAANDDTACPSTHAEAAVVGIAAHCADVAHAEGNRLVVGGLTWDLGVAGDLAAVGDFTCDGWLDAAALDLAGNVFVFDRWAGSGDDIPAGRLVVESTTARRLDVRSGAVSGCPVLALVADTGDPVVLSAGDLT